MENEKQTNNVILSEKEKRILGSLYRLKAGSVGNIAKETLINRTTLYPILERLLAAGFVTKTTVEGVTIFEPLPFLDAKDLLKRKTKRIVDETADILSWIKDQANAEGNSLISDIKYFSGHEGVQNLYSDTWRDNPKKLIRAITDYHKAYESMGNFFNKDYFQRRIAYGIRIKNLLPDSPEGRRDMKTAKQMLRQMRFIRLFKDLGIELNIYGNKIAIVAFDKDNPSGVLIKNQIIAKAFENIFEHIWELSGKKS